jgi:peptide/nickel transport system substrate-binding protein
MRRRTIALSMMGSLLLAACGDGGEGELGGTVIVGSAADADALLPMLSGVVQGRLVGELLFDRLADVGPSLNVNGDSGFLPRLARSWAWSPDSLRITFEIHPDARWHDGTPVRAADVRSGYRVTTDRANGSNLASNLADIDSVAVTDSLHATVHFARRGAEQFFSATQIFPLPSHLVDTIPSGSLRRSALVTDPVGSGRFRFVSWEPKARLELAAVDGHYRGRPKLDRVVFTITAEPATGLARVWAGDTDVWEPLTPNDVAEAARHEHVRIVTGTGWDYGFLTLNFRDPRDSTRAHPVFGDREVRRAITQAVDREELVQAVFDSLAVPALGPFVRGTNTADTTLTQIPFDRDAAAARLDALGWRPGPDGIRRKGGQRLSFGILFPTSSAVRNRMAVLLQEQLRQVGVEVRIDAVEFGAMRDLVLPGKFDALLNGYRVGPSPTGARGSWGSPAIARGSRNNVGRYANPAFDAAVERGLAAIPPAERRAAMREAYQTIIDDAAAIWLYEVKNAAAVHRRLVIPAWRSDAWWMTLGDWSVDPAQRLPRDARPTTP